MNHRGLAIAVLVIFLLLLSGALVYFERTDASIPNAPELTADSRSGEEKVAEIQLGKETTVPLDAESLCLGSDEYDFNTLLSALPQFPSLKEIRLEKTDLTLEQVEALRSAAPRAALSYTVELAGRVYDGQAQELDLSALDSDALRAVPERLEMFPALQTIDLASSSLEKSLEPEVVEAIAQAAPQAALQYSVEIGGSAYPREASAVDLSMLSAEELASVTGLLPLLPELREIELMNAAGESNLDKAAVRSLMDAVPDADVHYEFTLFGKRISTLDERVEYDSVTLTNADESAIREALDILPKCTYFKLDEDRYGIDDAVMGSICADYPDAHVVWRIFVSDRVNLLTDEEILRITFALDDSNCYLLQYCTNTVYLDLGHNSPLSDISFIANMPRLECLILSGSSVKDISYLSNCPHLTWAEFNYCTWIEDVGPLSQLQELKYLNVSFTSVTDIKPLENVPLERFVSFGCRIPYDDKNLFVEQHPDCLVGFVGEQPYGYPWRYNEGFMGASNFFEYYSRMREIFIYDDKPYLNNKDSIYGPGYLELRPYNLVYDENWQYRPVEEIPYQQQKGNG